MYKRQIVGITSTNPYPERTIEFLDFIASDEGQKLIMSGIDGVNYTVKDGVRTIDEATLCLLYTSRCV